MWKWLVCSVVIAIAAEPLAANVYRPAFRPEDMTDRPAGAANEVAVLGTPHLSGLPASFRPDLLAPLLDRLAAWRPAAIATEDMAGLRCDSLRRQPERNASVIRSYCFDPAAAGAASGLDVPAATDAVERTLAEWPEAPSAAQRRRLALLFLAAGEPVSAVVQWLRLPPAERRAADGLTEALVADLNQRQTRRNESYLIAAPLAARLGLERVWGVEDQPRASGADGDKAAYAAAVTGAWDNPTTHARKAADDALFARLAEPDGLLALYRAFNAPDYAAQKYRSDWGAALTEPSPRGYGRQYVAYWETRNLRMVANIREVLGTRPGMRLLALVGASHKAYYEAYLAQSRDVALVDIVPILR